MRMIDNILNISTPLFGRILSITCEVISSTIHSKLKTVIEMIRYPVITSRKIQYKYITLMSN